MRVFITGEKGFIARNLPRVAQERIHWINDDLVRYKWLNANVTNLKGEVDFTSHEAIKMLEEALVGFKCDAIIHNGAWVGTDVCACHPAEAIHSNVFGTYMIAMLAKKLQIPVIYIGTTVIYDTQQYQNTYIDEDSFIFPRTLYASTKLDGEHIIRAYCEETGCAIIRPLFCYGGDGDMNSLIAKSIYNDIKGRKKPFKIFLDPQKIKDYMHVDDFCEAVVLLTLKRDLHNGIDFNVSADDPMPTWAIEQAIKDVGIDTSYIQWVPGTDYLGNHRITNSLFKSATGNEWRPRISLVEGVRMVKESIEKSNENYNPFFWLDYIEKQGMDVETHYNFRGK